MIATTIQGVLHVQGSLFMYAPVRKRPTMATERSCATLPDTIPHGKACSSVRAARSWKRHVSSTDPAPMPRKSASRWT